MPARAEVEAERAAPREESSASYAVLPYNPRLFELATTQWEASDWRGLSQLKLDEVANHPDRAKLAILSAAASLQLGDRRAAREQAQAARQWGCDKRFASAVLVAGARHTLGRASLAARREHRSTEHFQRALFAHKLSSEARRVAQDRIDECSRELRKRKEEAAARRKSGVLTSTAAPPVGWIAELVERCFRSEDVHESVDRAMASLLATPDDKIRFLMQLAEHFQRQRDTLTSVHYLNTARECSHGADTALRRELAKRLIAAGQADVAMDMYVDEALSGEPDSPQDGQVSAALREAYRRTRTAAQSRTEHGHELLLAYLKLHLPRLNQAAAGRPLNLIEIGTTRENVPGQGSTAKIAEFCKQQGLRFTTVDMDPHNSRMAAQMFERLGVDFKAVTMKGEDFLRTCEGPLDLLFLDAYDFDHGKHSELRQSRYAKFLGSRIDEQACHRMHLDCAQSAAEKLSSFGLICIDDTWVENDAWTAKGTLAMPYLLSHGFELLDARNRAALLARAAAGSA